MAFVARGCTEDHDQLDAELCSVCLQTYTDPRLLPCLHALCKECITQLSVTANKGEINCPICRTVCQLPESGASGLLRDVSLATRKGNDGALSTLALHCVMCDVGDTSSARAQAPAWWCKKCEGVLCDAHITPHIMATKSEEHVIRSLDTTAKAHISETIEKKSDAGAYALDVQLCNQHGEQLRLHCGVCDTLICGDCGLFGDHQDHKPIQRMSDILKERKLEVAKEVDNLRDNTVARLECSLQAVDEVCTRLEQRAEKVRFDIQQAGKTAVQTVERQVALILQEVDDMKEGRLKVLHQQRDELKVHLGAVQNAIHFSQRIMEKSNGGDPMLALLRALKARVSALVSTEFKREPQHHASLLFLPANEAVASRKAEQNVGGVISCTASARYSRIAGELSKVASRQEAVSFAVELRDNKNKALTAGGDMIATKWMQTSNPECPDISVVDHNNGVYTISCFSASAGKYRLSVLVNSEPIQSQVSMIYHNFQWSKEDSHPNVVISKDGQKASLSQGSGTDYCSVMGSPAMRHGEHTWKIKFGGNECQAGIACKPLSISRLGDCFTVTYNWYGRKGGCNRRDGVEWDKARPCWLAGDTVELCLSCELHTLHLRNLRSQVGSTLTNLPDKEYFPFVTLRQTGDFAELVD